MKFQSKIGLILFCVFGVANYTHAALTVTTTDDATALSSLILGDGIINATNFSFTGGSFQSGIFSGGSSAGLGFDTGIILSTGTAADAIGPNTNGNTSTGGPQNGDPDLSDIAGTDTRNAAILQFDFESTGGNLFFNYVFASEEYPGPNGDPGFVNIPEPDFFNDVFAFFLDDINIATIPGTTNPFVSVDNINSNNNSAFFKDNSAGAFNIGYDGFTVVLTAMAMNLDAGSHTIRLAIADAGDDIIDSAVFIQGGSFSDTPMPIPLPFSALFFASGLIGLFGTRYISNKS